MIRPKRIAYTALHYGREYLAWAVRSAQDHVDEFHFWYTPRPSFGHQSSISCPETEEQLYAEAPRLTNKPTFWHRNDDWKAENLHRGAAVDHAKASGAETVLCLDADEIWDPDTLGQELAAAEASPARSTLVPFAHFWRSFWTVCKDPSRPVRILNLRGSGDRYSDQKLPVLHFGYAQSEVLTRYKISIHGHLAEWRREWFDSKFMAWVPGCSMKDVHPTCGWNTSFNDYFWNPVPTDPELRSVIDKTLKDHPYYPLEIIR